MTRFAPLFLAACLALAAPAALQAQTIIEEWASVKAPPPPELKPVTIDARQTALLVMDFNKSSCVPARRARCAAVLPKLKKLLADARTHGLTVIHTTAGTATPADISPELAPIAGEPVFNPGLNKLASPALLKILKDKGVTTLLLVGTSANGAVLFTAGGAAQLDYKIIVPVDGMPADGAYQEQFAVWDIANGPTVREHATLTRIDLIKF
jgi:nicotinamidase-related amidase